MTNSNIAFKPYLQGLRAIAVMLVIASHADIPQLSGGFIGVDMFFVISGFLITGILAKELKQTGTIHFSNFYSRRLKRLFPALLLMVCTVYFFAHLHYSSSELLAKTQSTPYALSWVSNVYFAFNIIDYFNEIGSKDLFLHTWSLGVEEQFYLIWPLLLLAIFKASSLGARIKSPSFNDRLIFGFCSAIMLSLLLSLVWTPSHPLLSFYMMPSRIWQFAMGGLAYSIGQKYFLSAEHKNPTLIPTVIILSGLISIAIGAVFITTEMTYPGWLALIPTIGTTAVIVSAEALPSKTLSIISNRPMKWLGDRSYSLYLWHWPIIVMGLNDNSDLQDLGVLALLTLLAAIISYRLIEYPLWQGSASKLKNKNTFIAASLITTAVISFTIYINNTETSASPVPANKSSSRWRTDVPDIYKVACDTWYTSEALSPCIIDSGTTTKTIVMAADSIGAQWFSIIPALFPPKEWRIIVHTKSACPIVDEDYFYKRIGKIYDMCTNWKGAVITDIEKISPNIVIIGSSSRYPFSETQWKNGSIRILNRLSKATTQVIIIPGTPKLGFDGPSCIEKYISADGNIPKGACVNNKKPDKAAKNVLQYLNEVSTNYSNVSVLNLNEITCPNEICSAASADGNPVFRDGQHLTNTFVISKIVDIAKLMPQATNRERHHTRQ